MCIRDRYIDQLLATNRISVCKTPTESCARARFILKPDGQVRLVVDYRSVNLTIKRTGYPFTPTSKVLQKIRPDTGLFWKLDFLQGYYQIPLHEEDKHLTAMILPWGKYIFNYLPIGLNQAADGFNLTNDIFIANTERIEKSTDDILGLPRDFNEACSQLAQVLTKCIRNCFIVSRKKNLT